MKKLITISLALLLVYGCNVADTQTKTSDTTLSHYLVIKDGLVETDGATVQSEAKEWLANIETSEMKVLVERMASTSDVRIQREAFNELSEQMMSYVEKNDTDITLYKQYCPMAFFNKGAYWLSTEEKVLNPYFGELMLTCGEVKEIIEVE